MSNISSLKVSNLSNMVQNMSLSVRKGGCVDGYDDIALTEPNDEVKDPNCRVQDEGCPQGQCTLNNLLTAMKGKPAEDGLPPNPDSGCVSECEDVREKWSNQIEFFLSCMGYAVGIGNVWRFPYKCYKNGGGVFLIPYVIMLFLAALPLFYMELVLGQFGQLGPNKIFGQIAPVFQGLGYGMLMITIYVSIYYNVIIAWCIYYTFAGFTSKLEWESCDNWFNTPDCFTPEFDLSCDGMFGGKGGTWWNNTCIPVSQYCEIHFSDGYNHTHCFKESSNSLISLAGLKSRKSPAEEYFRRSMLLMETDSSLDNMGDMNWKLAGCLLLSWLICFACLIKGVKSAGKVVWFTALFPYVVLIILLVRGVTLPGAADGIYFYITPDWSKLKNVNVWCDAATQIFYSMGPAFGGLITLSSYNPRNANCQRDAIIVAFANSFTSVFAGFVIFSILGFMAKELGVDVSEVVEGGTALAFIAYPTAVTKLPVSPLWSFLFFMMLLTLGLDSQFTMVESLITAVYDEIPALRNYKWRVVGGVSLVGFLLGLPICLQGGFYLFVLMDDYSGSWSLIFLAILEVVLIAWIYGTKPFVEDIKSMGLYTNRWIELYWTVCWKYTAPLLLIFILIFMLAGYTPAREGEYVFPVWANVLGWLISLSSILVVIPFGLIEVYKVRENKQSWKSLFECDFIWRTQARNMCTVTCRAETALSPDITDRSGLMSPENLKERSLILSQYKLGVSEKSLLSQLQQRQINNLQP